MHLSPDERILKVYHHHYFPYAILLAKTIGASIPFYFVLFLFADAIDGNALLLLNAAIVLLFLLVVAYITFVYWMDRLIITNKRVVYIDWKFITIRTESEAKLNDIQDVRTVERGVLSSIPFLDYGIVTIRTASDKTLIEFPEAPNPEAIRHVIYQIQKQFHIH